MFDDIKIFFDNVQWKTEPKIKNGELYYELDLKYNWKNIDIVIDENVYDNIMFPESLQVQKIKNYKFRIDFDTLQIKKLSFKVTVNYKFFIKTVNKYINDFINLDVLLESLIFFKETSAGKKYNKDIDLLIKDIECKTLDDMLIDNEKEKDRIIGLLVNSKTYKTFTKKMNDKDLMLLITSYIFSFNPIDITQEDFDKMVKVAQDNEDSAENIWRLGITYDGKGYNYDLLDKFFVNNKDIWYLGEYIKGINVNQKRIVNLILKTNDKKYIMDILKDEIISTSLEEKYIDMLKNSLR